MQELMTSHPDVAFVSNLADKLSGLPQVSALSRVWGKSNRFWKLMRHNRRLTYWLGPSQESNGISNACQIPMQEREYRRLHPEVQRPLNIDDFTPESADLYKKKISDITRFQRKTVSVIKSTAHNSRLPFIDSVFPNAFYIHIVRDPRAVVYSMLKVEWSGNLTVFWKDFKTVEEHINMGGDPVELIAEYYLRIDHMIAEFVESLSPDRYIRMKYEDLTQSPSDTLREVFDKLPLNFTPQFEKRVRSFNIDNRNYKWRDRLQRHEIDQMTHLLGDSIASNGYSLDVFDE